MQHPNIHERSQQDNRRKLPTATRPKSTFAAEDDDDSRDDRESEAPEDKGDGDEGAAAQVGLSHEGGIQTCSPEQRRAQGSGANVRMGFLSYRDRAV